MDVVIWHHQDPEPMGKLKGSATMNLHNACTMRQQLVDWSLSLADEGMASGIYDGFDIEAFVDALKPAS